MTDPLIDRLVADLSPRKRLMDIVLWFHCSTCLAMIASLVLVFIGLRSDYLLSVQNSALFWKPGIFLMAGIGSLLLITDISRPLGGVKKHHLIPIVLAGAILIWQFSVQMAEIPHETIVHSLYNTSALYCLSIILVGGGVALIVVWKLWLSKAASRHPALLGMLAGFNAGCLAATAYALHCDKDIALYISVYYGLPILTLSFIGLFLGKNFLKW